MQQEALKEVPFSALPAENYINTCKIGKSAEVENLEENLPPQI